MGRTCRPASGSTTISCAAGMPSADRVASTGTLRLTSASAIGPSSWWRADDPTKPTARPSRLSSAPWAGQPVLGAVEVEQGEPARRTAQGVHPSDRLLPAVAALVEVDGRADPARLVGDRAVVRVEPDDAPHRARCAAPRRPRVRQPARPHRRTPSASRGARTRTSRRGPGPPAARPTASSSVTSVTSTCIMNRIFRRKSTSAAAAPGSVWATNAVPSSTPWKACSTWPCGLSTSARVQVPVGELEEVLGGQRVEPGQPVRPLDAEHVAVGQVRRTRLRPPGRAARC